MRRPIELLYVLIRRDIKARYSQSIIGIAWAVLQPLALMFTFTIVFSTLLKFDSGGVPYPVFLYSALLPWTFFSLALTRGTLSTVSDEPLIKKLPLRAEYYPVSMVLSCLLDFAISLPVFVGMLLWFHLPLSWGFLYIIPLMGLTTLFVIAVSLFTSAANAYYRDVQYGLPLVVQVWMFGTPVIYAYSVIPQGWHWLYLLNPMAPIVESFRRVLVYQQSPDVNGLLWGCLITGVVMVFSYLVFWKLSRRLSDVV